MLSECVLGRWWSEVESVCVKAFSLSPNVISSPRNSCRKAQTTCEL